MDYTVDSSCLCNIQQLTNSQTIVSEPIWEEETSEEEIFKQETTNRQMYSCALGIQDAVETLFQCQPQGFLMGVSMLLGGSWEFKCSQKATRNCGRGHHHHPSMNAAWPGKLQEWFPCPQLNLTKNKILEVAVDCGRWHQWKFVIYSWLTSSPDTEGLMIIQLWLMKIVTLLLC